MNRRAKFHLMEQSLGSTTTTPSPPRVLTTSESCTSTFRFLPEPTRSDFRLYHSIHQPPPSLRDCPQHPQATRSTCQGRRCWRCLPSPPSRGCRSRRVPTTRGGSRRFRCWPRWTPSLNTFFMNVLLGLWHAVLACRILWLEGVKELGEWAKTKLMGQARLTLETDG